MPGAFHPRSEALATFTWTPSSIAGGEGAVGFTLSDPNVTVIPEPADMLLMGAGLVAMGLVLRRRRAAPKRGNAIMAIGLAA